MTVTTRWRSPAHVMVVVGRLTRGCPPLPVSRRRGITASGT